MDSSDSKELTSFNGASFDTFRFLGEKIHFGINILIHNIMKNIVFTLVLAMISSIATAQTDLSQLKQNDKNEYLERLSMEMLKEMVPDYVDDCKIFEISDPIEFTKKMGKYICEDEEYAIKYIGKKYYSVDYTTKYEHMGMEMVGHIIVRIWEHNGETLTIYFDLGEPFWFLFLHSSYKDFLKFYPYIQ